MAPGRPFPLPGPSQPAATGRQTWHDEGPVCPGVCMTSLPSAPPLAATLAAMGLAPAIGEPLAGRLPRLTLQPGQPLLAQGQCRSRLSTSSEASPAPATTPGTGRSAARSSTSKGSSVCFTTAGSPGRLPATSWRPSRRCNWCGCRSPCWTSPHGSRSAWPCCASSSATRSARRPSCCSTPRGALPGALPHLPHWPARLTRAARQLHRHQPGHPVADPPAH